MAATVSIVQCDLCVVEEGGRHWESGTDTGSRNHNILSAFRGSWGSKVITEENLLPSLPSRIKGGFTEEADLSHPGHPYQLVPISSLLLTEIVSISLAYCDPSSMPVK